MPKPNTREIHAAIAAFIKETNEPFSTVARRLRISTSTVRRVASEFGIVRRHRLNQSVLDTIRRESSQNDGYPSNPVGLSLEDPNGSAEDGTDTGGIYEF